MNILIIGSGGREYAIGLRLKQDKNVKKLYFSPGNGATKELGTNIIAKDYYELADFAKKNDIALSVVGPENALSAGVVDIFKEKGLNIFGPTKAAAMLESSKTYMKDFLHKNGIRTARFLNTNNFDEASKFIDTLGQIVVVKADGLCAGKGVIIAQSHDEAKKAALDMLSGDSFGDAGKSIVIEEFLDGFELSFFAICDGKSFVSLPVAQDHKRLLDNDEGPNTGGMGAYAPSPLASKELIKRVEQEVVAPTLAGMQKENAPFCGVLFVGLMIVNNTPYVLEFNVRFGDPECEVLMPLIDGNLSEILYDAATGKLIDITLKDDVAVGVVMASKNYPYDSTPKTKITIKDIPDGSHIAYAGVSEENGVLYSDGGRILVAVGVGKDIKEAHKKAYELVQNIDFDGSKFRKDIAYQALK
ncbi:phosphoribosylamine--glycine ligase [Campylobacter hyointestinalis]|uniref:Phosphoribosylamine--glycine ligase n=1 Tax=Campylobacter hyointestinalis subsp. hyointestinalis TaxID=91352 RepID=A0A855NCU4_CAMHY|nr:phosphoribosylamine--glycine ligase [Campylobacter hyointestinalis]ANE32900.1 phosphoribosylamine-glycine ligase [Campylobacter hyointestinalis subsp. hyointestinalis LMG 9260]KEA43701.1 phosphoribosylamine--glycine ligase [Campylobacter hyointestinalis subsp. hyointestinalis]MBT0612691.1 phosphoribosylamine--glycine ligase [Campylobacter hyointestinalis subsp. hyointestinalis]MDL2347441.1 phosphoribosylamine--glycine ligase [Campylobacter hyointestinalis]MDL2349098.1 phosphoribosylamine--g